MDTCFVLLQLRILSPRDVCNNISIIAVATMSR